MASSGGSNPAPLENETENSLEKIKRQLTSASGRTLLQGPLFKRSETLRKWNERWVTLDPTTGKMEYRARRNDLTPKGTIIFDANSVMTLSPINFHGLQKYDGCCFYIGTPQKKEYFLCAETPGAAKAWVATLRASQLVLKAHREAVNSLSGNGSTRLGTVAAVVAAANSTARESAKEIGAAMQISMKAALGAVTNQQPNNGYMDDLTIMKETLRVKDEELHQLARELRARDSTIKEIADKLSETAEAAESAASAAHAMDKERRAAVAELQRLSREMDEKLQAAALKIKESDEKLAFLTKDRDNTMRQRDAALQEAHLWRSELAKARERAVIMEGALVRAEEKSKLCLADAEARVKEATEKEIDALNVKEEVLKEMSRVQAELRRLHAEAEIKKIQDVEVQSHTLADCNRPVEETTHCQQDGIEEAHHREAVTLPSGVDPDYVVMNEMKIQHSDQSTQNIATPEYPANPSENNFTTTVECHHLEASCCSPSVDLVEMVGSPHGHISQLSSADEAYTEKMQDLNLTTNGGPSDRS